MSEERKSPLNAEGTESGLLLSVDPIADSSVDFTTLSDDNNNAPDTDASDTVGDTDDTDATDTDSADDADGTD